MTTGKVLGRLTGHRDAVASVAFAPDGRTLASAGWDTSVLLWDVADLTRQAAAGQPVRLTPSELAKLWADLGGGAVPAYDALWKLVRRRRRWLSARAAGPVKALDEQGQQRIARLIAELAASACDAGEGGQVLRGAGRDRLARRCGGRGGRPGDGLGAVPPGKTDGSAGGLVRGPPRDCSAGGRWGRSYWSRSARRRCGGCWKPCERGRGCAGTGQARASLEWLARRGH